MIRMNVSTEGFFKVAAEESVIKMKKLKMVLLVQTDDTMDPSEH